jgi:hypothetical protein
MKVWYDEELGCNFCKPDCVDEWLEMIWTIGVDYDGCEKPESLKELIDELVDMAHKARVCLKDGHLFSNDVYKEEM